MISPIEIGVIASTALVAYHHVGYPILMAAVSRLGADRSPLACGSDELPEMTIVMPAYNEAAYIARKLMALEALDYPMDRIKVLVGCDGCTDRTAELAHATARKLSSLAIDVREYPMNRGKVAVLNDLMASVETEITVFTDVSALPDRDALQRVAAWFQDRKVGAVGGGYALADKAGRQQRLYNRYQNATKIGESRIAGLVGAHGAFYAIRTNAFSPLAWDTINDDFMIPVLIGCRGLRTVYDPTIKVREMERVSDKADMRRRRRIGAGNFQQAIRLMPAAMRVGNPGLLYSLFSGKFLRVAMAPLIGAAYLLIVSAAAQRFGWEAGIALAFGMALPLGTRIGRYVLNGHLQSAIGAIEYLKGKHRCWGRVVAPKTAFAQKGEAL